MRELSIFVDESGDFGPYEPHAPYYLITLVFHNQADSIADEIEYLERHVCEYGFPSNHAVHAGPLVRRVRPSDYRLFQPADMICTLELLSVKVDENSLSKSEQEFFGGVRNLKKNYLKPLARMESLPGAE